MDHAPPRCASVSPLSADDNRQSNDDQRPMGPSSRQSEPAFRRLNNARGVSSGRDDIQRPPARSRRRAGQAAIDRRGLCRTRGQDPDSPCLPEIPSVTSVQFRHDGIEWDEDSSVSGDLHVNVKSRRRSVETIEMPPIEQLRDLEGDSLISSCSNSSKSDGSELKIARRLFMVAAHSDRSGRPAHWAAAGKVDVEEGRAALDLTTFMSRGHGGGDGAAANDTTIHPGISLGRGAGSSIQSDEESQGSSKLWDHLEGCRLPRDSASASPPMASTGEAPTGASFARRCVRVVVGVATLAAVGWSAMYLVFEYRYLRHSDQ